MRKQAVILYDTNLFQKQKIRTSPPSHFDQGSLHPPLLCIQSTPSQEWNTPAFDAVFLFPFLKIKLYCRRYRLTGWGELQLCTSNNPWSLWGAEVSVKGSTPLKSMILLNKSTRRGIVALSNLRVGVKGCPCADPGGVFDLQVRKSLGDHTWGQKKRLDAGCGEQTHGHWLAMGRRQTRGSFSWSVGRASCGVIEGKYSEMTTECHWFSRGKVLSRLDQGCLSNGAVRWRQDGPKKLT